MYKKITEICFLSELSDGRYLKTVREKHPCNIIEELQNTRMNTEVKGNIIFADSVGNQFALRGTVLQYVAYGEKEKNWI